MSNLDILHDVASRPHMAFDALADELTVAKANVSPLGHPNSVSWLLWHTGREIDFQLSQLTGRSQVWDCGNVSVSTGIVRSADDLGYGDSPESARQIRVKDAQALDSLIAYVRATMDDLASYLNSLDADALDEVVDTYDGADITRAVRLVSIIDDASQHIAQIAYVLGMPDLEDGPSEAATAS